VNLVHHILANGLQVLLREVHSAPVASWWLAYRVGSRNETPGHTGASHWVEHMLFKGTPRHPRGTLDFAIDRLGGQWNAFTSSDYTMYYETLPADHIGLALELEADRMVNALFDPDDVEAERSVILSERRGNENRPTFWLGEQMRLAAFQQHGYRHEIIGQVSDLESLSRDELYDHYRSYYRPANAVAVAVGAFDSAALLEQIEALYGTLPAEPAPQQALASEVPPLGERRVVVERPGHTAFLRLCHYAPAATEEDWFRLEILDSVLSGSSGLSGNKTSRLYQALVKRGVAASVGGGLQETLDPYLYSLSLTLNDGQDLPTVEALLLEEVERVQQDGIRPNELARAKKQARAAFAYGTESVTNQAYSLAQSAMLGDIHWFERYVARLEAVSLDDVRQVAQTYLSPQRRIVGWLIPTGLDEDSL